MMIKQLLDANVALVRQRVSEADCPTTPALSVETLEHMILDLTNPMTPEPAQPAESPEARALEICPQCNGSGVGVADTVCTLCDGSGGVSARQISEPDVAEEPFTPREIIAAILLEHDAGGITMATLHDARKFISSTARPTERGAVEEARDKCRADVERLTANLERENGRWRPTRAHYEGARNDLRLAANALDTALALPATDQAAEVEHYRAALERIAKGTTVHLEGGEAWPSPLGARNSQEIAGNALATQPATGRTMGGEDGLRQALEQQMEQQEEDLPSSMARDRGLVWLEGWFDLRAALQNGGE